MGITIQTFPAGPIDTNAYLVSDDESHEALIIDAPYGVTATITAAATTAGLHISRIVLTHAHWDHIADAAALAAATGAPIAAHPLATPRLAEPGSTLMDLPFTIPPVTADEALNDGDEVRLGTTVFQVLHLPGHDPAHIVLHAASANAFLGGDVVFPNGHGRIDIPGADEAAMQRSLTRVAALPPDTVIYPGHGATTTIGAEPWLLALRSDGAS